MNNSKINRLRLISFKILLVLLLLGCTSPYYGYNEAQWNTMSAEEKQLARDEYQTVLDQRSIDQHKQQLDEITGKIIEQGRGISKPQRRY